MLKLNLFNLRHKSYVLGAVLCIAAASIAATPNVLVTSQSAKAYFDQNNLLNDPTFIDTGSMSAGDIQNFLNSQGGFLKDFSEGGRSAAQIIYDAAHGHGDASGTANAISITTSTGTVNPRVIISMLQKEQGLINMPARNDDSLRVAMGYICSETNPCNTYAGFTKQVENGSWQLRYNYEAAAKDSSWKNQYYGGQSFPSQPANPGQTVTMDGQSVTLANAATASLYRYDPHISGNKSFVTIFNQYFPSYHYAFVDQNGYPKLPITGANDFVLRVRNTGSVTWQKGLVNLATDRNKDRVPEFTREGPSGSGYVSGWISPNRIQFEESSVAPGAIATFSFWMRNDTVSPGTYHEYFRVVADGIGWMEDYGIYWDVTATPLADAYHVSFLNQNAYPTLSKGQAANFVVNVKNTGSATWKKGVVNLGTDRGLDRIPQFTRESDNGSASGWISANRITMQQDSVAPGETATFSFWMRNDTVSPGTYAQYFRVVADNITWMDDLGIYWNVTSH